MFLTLLQKRHNHLYTYFTPLRSVPSYNILRLMSRKENENVIKFAIITFKHYKLQKRAT